MVLRTRYLDIHQLVAKSVSDSNGRAGDVFPRNFRRTGRQRDSVKYRKRRAADRDPCGSEHSGNPGDHPGSERMLIDFKGAEYVYIACGYTNLRRGIDGLASLVQQ